ncbi:MAG TPA: hypothetical protein VGI56_09230 [Galbitalea sp.]
MPTLTKVRIWIAIFIICLVGAGLTAFPLEAELGFATSVLHTTWLPANVLLPGFVSWIDLVDHAVVATTNNYPFIFYGTDWLAFAHIVIAIAFIGPFRDPVRNIWIIQWGMIACVLVVPLAAIAGPIRGIPWGWELIDMSFGVIGIIPLIIVYRLIRRLEREQKRAAAPTAALVESN